MQSGDGGCRLEKIVRTAVAPVDAGGNVVFREPLLKLFARFGLNARSGGAVGFAKRCEFCGNLDSLATGAHRSAAAREHSLHAVRIEPPLGDEPVGRQPGMQRTIGEAVAIRKEAANDHAEAREIEVAVLQVERVEGPLDQVDAASQRLVALEKFQAPAHAAIAELRQDSSDVGMQK